MALPSSATVAGLLLTSIITLSEGFVPLKQKDTNFSTKLSGKVDEQTDSAPPPTFPLSTRQALLIKKAKELGVDEPGSYSSVGWSNRLGSVLTPVAPEGVYTADRPFYWNNIDVGCRMTVVELPSIDGETKPDLWIHSPVGLDGPLQAKLDEVGTVKHVVSPNYEHVKFAKQWADAYPNANMWACPGMMEKEPEVRWTAEIPFGCRPKSWSGGTATTTSYPPNFWDTSLIQPLHIDTEGVPLLNFAFFNEVIFYHAPSQTLMTTDFYWNYPAPNGVPNSNYIPSEENGPWPLSPSVEKIPLGSKLWKRGMDQLFQPFYMNLMVKDQDKFDDIVRFLVKGGEWSKATSVVPAHGDIIRGQAYVRDLLTKHFNLE